MEIFEKEGTLGALQGKIAYLKEKLRPFEALNHVGEIRQRGFMVGIELVVSRKSREPYPPAAQVGQRVTRAARRRGLIIRPLGHVIVLMPPLSMTQEEIDRLCDIACASIREVTENPP